MPDPLDDRELISRAQRGEQAAFAELLARHQKRLYHFVYRLLGNHADTDDVVQETFVRAFRAIGRFAAKDTDTVSTSLERWLFTIASRRCLTWRRRRSREITLPLDEEQIDKLAGSERPLHEVLLASELQRAVRTAVSRLPGRQRVAVTLFEMEGWKIREIALAMACSPQTVKVHLFRARTTLQKELKTYVLDENEGVKSYEMPICPAADSRLAE